MEGTVFTEREQQIATVRRYPGLHRAEILGFRVINQLLVPESPRGRIKTPADDVIVDLVEAYGDAVAGKGCYLRLAGRRIIEILSVRRPGGECLEQIGLVADGDNTLVICVVEYQSALGVLHFGFGQTIGVKLHEGLVHRIGDER
jgi:hypothetical protein